MYCDSFPREDGRYQLTQLFDSSDRLSCEWCDKERGVCKQARDAAGDLASCDLSGGDPCTNAACPEDLCADGMPRRPIAGDCCACPSAIPIVVSGGSFDAPYYTSNGGAPPTLEVGKTYTFVDGGVSRSHPFRITGEDGGLPITITLDEANSAPEYYCEAHSSMKATFMIYMDLKVHGGNKAFTVDEFLSSKVKDLKKECNTAVEDGGRGGKWLGSKKEGNCFYTTWCEQFSKDKKGCKKAKVGAKKVCKYKKERKAITSGCAPPVKKKFCKEARDAKCAIKKK